MVSLVLFLVVTSVVGAFALVAIAVFAVLIYVLATRQAQ